MCMDMSKVRSLLRVARAEAAADDVVVETAVNELVEAVGGEVVDVVEVIELVTWVGEEVVGV